MCNGWIGFNGIGRAAGGTSGPTLAGRTPCFISSSSWSEIWSETWEVLWFENGLQFIDGYWHCERKHVEKQK